MGIFTRRRRWRSEKRRTQRPGQVSSRRVTGLYVAIFLVFGLLTLQLLRMQVLGSSQYRLLADGNRLRVERAPAPRGLILHRAGKQLVTNVPVWRARIIPA